MVCKLKSLYIASQLIESLQMGQAVGYVTISKGFLPVLIVLKLRLSSYCNKYDFSYNFRFYLQFNLWNFLSSHNIWTLCYDPLFPLNTTAHSDYNAIYVNRMDFS